MHLQFKYRHTYQLMSQTDWSFPLVARHTFSISLCLLPSSFESMDTRTHRDTLDHTVTFPFDSSFFFSFGLCEFILFSQLYIYAACFWYAIFSLFLSLSFSVCYPALLTFVRHIFFLVLFEAGCFFQVLFLSQLHNVTLSGLLVYRRFMCK